MTINMPRGDIRLVPFNVKDATGELSDIQFEEVYFTVKRNYFDQEPIFQKKLNAVWLLNGKKTILKLEMI